MLADSSIYDNYADRSNADSPVHNPDTIGVEGSMRYMADLQVDLDDVATLAIAEALSSPTMGEFNREGFVQGWKSSKLASRSLMELYHKLMAPPSADTLAKQQAAVAGFRTRLTTDHDFFKRVYKHTFLIARTPGQKAVALDAAIEFWRLLFSPPSISWITATTPWLDWWIEYLESKWKKTVNKDMWEQTLVFSQKSLQDETMSWWSEDGAWPGVLDEFVAYVNERKSDEGKMDVE